MNETKKSKKKSMSATIKQLRKKYNELYHNYDEMWHKYHKTRNICNLFIHHVPLRYYKIEFRIKNDEENIVTLEEVHEGFNAKHAIANCKEQHDTYPSTFELINIQLLAK